MTRRYAHPPTWGLREHSPYPQAVACEDLAVTRGQLDFDMSGNALNAFQLRKQNAAAARHARRALSELGMDLEDCVRVVLFFDDAEDESDLLRDVIEWFGASRPALVIVPLPAFPDEGLVLESEFFASKAVPRVAGAALKRQGSSGVVRAGDTIYLGSQIAVDADGAALHPGDLPSQIEVIRERLTAELEEFGARLDDLARLTTYYVGEGSTERWRELARHRARWFGDRAPVITDVPLRRVGPSGVVVAMDGFAFRGVDGRRLDFERHDGDGLGTWPIVLPHPAALRVGHRLLIGGRMPLSRAGEVVQPRVMEYQTRHCMEELRALLEGAGFGFADVLKMNTYYIGQKGSLDDLMRNFPIRASYFEFPGPASTGAYVSEHPFPGATITIEALAVKDRIRTCQPGA